MASIKYQSEINLHGLNNFRPSTQFSKPDQDLLYKILTGNGSTRGRTINHDKDLTKLIEAMQSRRAGRANTGTILTLALAGLALGSVAVCGYGVIKDLQDGYHLDVTIDPPHETLDGTIVDSENHVYQTPQQMNSPGAVQTQPLDTKVTQESEISIQPDPNRTVEDYRSISLDDVIILPPTEQVKKIRSVVRYGDEIELASMLSRLISRYGDKEAEALLDANKWYLKYGNVEDYLPNPEQAVLNNDAETLLLYGFLYHGHDYAINTQAWAAYLNLDPIKIKLLGSGGMVPDSGRDFEAFAENARKYVDKKIKNDSIGTWMQKLKLLRIQDINGFSKEKSSELWGEVREENPTATLDEVDQLVADQNPFVPILNKELEKLSLSELLDLTSLNLPSWKEYPVINIREVFNATLDRIGDAGYQEILDYGKENGSFSIISVANEGALTDWINLRHFHDFLKYDLNVALSTCETLQAKIASFSHTAYFADYVANNSWDETHDVIRLNILAEESNRQAIDLITLASQQEGAASLIDYLRDHSYGTQLPEEVKQRINTAYVEKRVARAYETIAKADRILENRAQNDYWKAHYLSTLVSAYALFVDYGQEQDAEQTKLRILQMPMEWFDVTGTNSIHDLRSRDSAFYKEIKSRIDQFQPVEQPRKQENRGGGGMMVPGGF
jgi:hypothetical protein